MHLKTETELDRMSPRENSTLDPSSRVLDGAVGFRTLRPRRGDGRGQDEHRPARGVADDRLDPGLGTSMILRMPLTLAIIPCLIVLVEGERYAIPQRDVEEAVCLHPGMKGRIEPALRHGGLSAPRTGSCRSCRFSEVLARRHRSRPRRRRRSSAGTKETRSRDRSPTSSCCGRGRPPLRTPGG